MGVWLLIAAIELAALAVLRLYSALLVLVKFRTKVGNISLLLYIPFG
jgi:hypothetical protein